MLKLLIVLNVIYFNQANVYDKCELALELRDRFFMFGRTVCWINTKAVGLGSYFRMCQLSSEYWCDRNYACGARCSSFVGPDFPDDYKGFMRGHIKSLRMLRVGARGSLSAQCLS